MYKAKPDPIVALASRIPKDAYIAKHWRTCKPKPCRGCPHGPYYVAQKRVRGRCRTWYVGSAERLAALRREWTRSETQQTLALEGIA